MHENSTYHKNARWFACLLASKTVNASLSSRPSCTLGLVKQRFSEFQLYLLGWCWLPCLESTSSRNSWFLCDFYHENFMYSLHLSKLNTLVSCKPGTFVLLLKKSHLVRLIVEPWEALGFNLGKCFCVWSGKISLIIFLNSPCGDSLIYSDEGWFDCYVNTEIYSIQLFRLFIKER